MVKFNTFCGTILIKGQETLKLHTIHIQCSYIYTEHLQLWLLSRCLETSFLLVWIVTIAFNPFLSDVANAVTHAQCKWTVNTKCIRLWFYLFEFLDPGLPHHRIGCGLRYGHDRLSHHRGLCQHRLRQARHSQRHRQTGTRLGATRNGAQRHDLLA